MEWGVFVSGGHMQKGVVLDVTGRVKPKEESDFYNGHRYILRFDPNGPEHERWVWKVNFTVVYPYVGASSSIDKARNAARRTIRRLQGDNERYIE